MLNPYEALANGIITQAVNDYRQAIKFLKKHPCTNCRKEKAAGGTGKTQTSQRARETEQGGTAS